MYKYMMEMWYKDHLVDLLENADERFLSVSDEGEIHLCDTIDELVAYDKSLESRGDGGIVLVIVGSNDHDASQGVVMEFGDRIPLKRADPRRKPSAIKADRPRCVHPEHGLSKVDADIVLQNVKGKTWELCYTHSEEALSALELFGAGGSYSTIPIEPVDDGFVTCSICQHEAAMFLEHKETGSRFYYCGYHAQTTVDQLRLTERSKYYNVGIAGNEPVKEPEMPKCDLGCGNRVVANVLDGDVVLGSFCGHHTEELLRYSAHFDLGYESFPVVVNGPPSKEV